MFKLWLCQSVSDKINYHPELSFNEFNPILALFHSGLDKFKWKKPNFILLLFVKI